MYCSSEYEKDKTSVIDLLNNSYLFFELLPNREGFLFFTNKNSNLDMLRDLLKLKKINAEAAKN